jgi:dipeptidyl aminopeptidase/acylaminoacyl peptidase
VILALLFLAGIARAERPAYSPERLALSRETSEVRISPDGRTLAFVSDITGAREVWTVPSRGGWASQLSSLGELAADLRYSPDGRSLVFTSDHGGDERPDVFVVAAEGGEAAPLAISTRAETSPRYSPNGRRLAFLSDPEQAFLSQLFVMDLASKAQVQLTHEAVAVKHPVWAADGRTIAVTRTGDDQKGELLLVDAASGAVTEIPPPVPGGLTIAEQFSPFSRDVLCRARNAKGFLQLYLVDVKTGRGQWLGFDTWDVDQAIYHPTAGIFFTRNEGGVSALYRLKTPAGKPEPLLAARGRIEDFDLDAAGDQVAYLWSDSTHASDAWVLDVKSGFKRRATSSMLAGVRPEALSRARLIQYPSFDGRQVAALYLEPPIRRLGSPPPLIVEVHGGPDWQTYDDFSAHRQALAEAGFAVLAPNFRGSTGYGMEWQALNRGDWGGGDRRDILEGVKHLAKRGEIDAKRVGITGESYGGYMTLYALARSNGEWAAGVERYGMPDLLLDYDLSKERFGDWYVAQMGAPGELYKERSAINHLESLKAPLLILQGANDTNVPPAESELVYKKLKELGRDVEFVVYPEEGHGFTKRRTRVDFYRRLVDFFVKRLGSPK